MPTDTAFDAFINRHLNSPSPFEVAVERARTDKEWLAQQKPVTRMVLEQALKD